ncbi:methyltransferase domain-containing protein [Maribellus comscasis]|uniref:Methyltransferase domain-containing protein n=1 Tax=Maribellus comscasis TaxID=2681766 RepID=A0A6I6K2A7_9BACT|nr:class I SAM-dependent methyltransferase [Maribellus comscasis]QGY47588.1 methyltransferase domain-containing protein [Maribellus comscasis]
MGQKETYWSRFADNFEERNNYVVGKADVDLILKKVAALKNLGNVLELGCSNGTFSKVLANNSDSLLATDLSEKMVGVARDCLKTFNNIRVEKADCFDLPYSDNSFDTVFMANLIHIVPNPENAIKECKRVLKKDGSLIVVSYTQKGMRLRYKTGLIYRYLKTYGKPPKGGRNFGLEDATSLLKSYKFKITNTELIGKKSKALFIKGQKK